jgi:hypothetical protein
MKIGISVFLFQLNFFCWFTVCFLPYLLEVRTETDRTADVQFLEKKTGTEPG